MKTITLCVFFLSLFCVWPAPILGAEPPQQPASANASAPVNPEEKIKFSIKAYLGYQDGFRKGTPRVFDAYRGYIGLSYRLSPKVTFSSTLDTAARRDEQGFFEVVLKHMFLGYAPTKDHELQFGQANVSWVPYMEDLVGDRFIQRSFTETEGYEKSTDMGMMAKGKFFGGALQYHASIVNGNGWNRIESNRGKDLQLRLTTLPFRSAGDWNKGIFTSVGGTQKFFDSTELRKGETPTGYRMHALAGYQFGGGAIGFEWLLTRDPASKMTAAHPSAETLNSAHGFGYSAFVNARLGNFSKALPGRLGVLARRDAHDPTRGSVRNDAHKRLTVGPYWVFNDHLQVWGGYMGVHYEGAARARQPRQHLLAVFTEVKF